MDFGDAFSSEDAFLADRDHVRGPRRQRLQRRRPDDLLEGPPGHGRSDRPGRGSPRGGRSQRGGRARRAGRVRPDPDGRRGHEGGSAIPGQVRTALVLALLAALAFAGVAGCGNDGAETRRSLRRLDLRRETLESRAEPRRRRLVEIVDFEFGPEEITVPAGTTITFTNQDYAAHTATADDSLVRHRGARQGRLGGRDFRRTRHVHLLLPVPRVHEGLGRRRVAV